MLRCAELLYMFALFFGQCFQFIYVSILYSQSFQMPTKEKIWRKVGGMRRPQTNTN